jgi:hypothetical protein
MLIVPVYPAVGSDLRPEKGTERIAEPHTAHLAKPPRQAHGCNRGILIGTLRSPQNGLTA